MKVVPTGQKPPMIADTQNSQAQADAKARAIARLSGQTQAQATPVPNPSQVSPEDMSALQTSQKPTNEATRQATEDTPAQTPEKQELPDAQLQALIRREKSLRQAAFKQDQAFKAREAELTKRQADLDAKAKELETGYIPRARLKNATLDVLAEEEISYDHLTQLQIEQQAVNPQVRAHISKLERQIEELKRTTEDNKKAQETQTQESYQAAIRVITSDTTKLVKNDSAGEFDFIKANGKTGISAVVKLIESHFRETGETMSVEDAAGEVEKEYVERFDRYNNIPKVQKRLQGQSNVQTPENEQTPALNKQPQTMKTLTNAAASTRQLSAKERAILAFDGKLK